MTVEAYLDAHEHQRVKMMIVRGRRLAQEGEETQKYIRQESPSTVNYRDCALSNEKTVQCNLKPAKITVWKDKPTAKHSSPVEREVYETTNLDLPISGLIVIYPDSMVKNNFNLQVTLEGDSSNVTVSLGRGEESLTFQEDGVTYTIQDVTQGTEVEVTPKNGSNFYWQNEDTKNLTITLA